MRFDNVFSFTFILIVLCSYSSHSSRYFNANSLKMMILLLLTFMSWHYDMRKLWVLLYSCVHSDVWLSTNVTCHCRYNWCRNCCTTCINAQSCVSHRITGCDRFSYFFYFPIESVIAVFSRLVVVNHNQFSI